MKSLPYLLAAVSGALLGALLMHQVVRAPRSVKEAELTSPQSRPAAVVTERAAVDVERLLLEKNELAVQLAEARSRLAERDATLTRTNEQLAELRRPMEADILSSSLRAELKSGEVVVTGGYRLPDGKRLYAFAQPVVETVDGVKQVKIEGRLLSMTEDAGKTVGLDVLATNAANTLQHGEVWVADEQHDVLALLSADAGTSLVTMPAITLRSGASGLLEVGDIKLKITPQLTGTEGAMNMELRLEQPQVPAATGVPEHSPTLSPGDQETEARR